MCEMKVVMTMIKLLNVCSFTVDACANGI
jgi:hypothetical protein